MTRLGHVGVLILLFCVAFPFFGWPAVLWVLFLIPAAVALWIERTRTTVSSAGLDLRTAFGTRHLDWSQIRGLRIPKRGFVRAHLIDDSEIALPAVSYDRLRHLVEASDGRIPDPFVQPEEPAGEASDDAPETDPAPAPNGLSADKDGDPGPRE
ncbi:PH domain-containing protein [Nocardia sp. BMG51109]|uniref:PH domain-containing protein n=1 Tax=Nocardia sp. BMG51109 TaxID=1056816 RepID=UPI001E481273|nr:PH domain-containing protein [Nocardia sp. BMG51109]